MTEPVTLNQLKADLDGHGVTRIWDMRNPDHPVPLDEAAYRDAVAANSISADDRAYIARELRSVFEDVLPMLEAGGGL